MSERYILQFSGVLTLSIIWGMLAEAILFTFLKFTFVTPHTIPQFSRDDDMWCDSQCLLIINFLLDRKKHLG